MTPRDAADHRLRRVRGVRRLRRRAAVVRQRLQGARVLVRRHLPDRPPRPERPHRLHGPDLARPRRVHGDRRLHDRDPHGRERAVRRADLGRDEGLWTLPIAGLVAGLVGLAFGFPALRLSGLYLALATFAIAVAMPSTVKRFEEFSGGGQGIQLFGAGADRLEAVRCDRAHVNVLGRSRSRRTTGCTTSPGRSRSCCSPARGSSCAGARDAPSARFATPRRRPSPPASASRATRRSRSGSAPRTRASRAGSSRSRARSSTRTRSRSRSRSSCSSASSIGGLGGLSGLVFGAIFIAFLPALGAGPGSRLAAAGPDHRGDAEAGRAGDRLRRRAHPPDVRAAERRRRAVPPHRAADHESSLLSVGVIARRSVLAAALGAALVLRPADGVRRLGRRPGHQRDDHRHRRNVAAHRPRRVVRLGRARREGVSRLRERRRRRREAEVRLSHRRRRVQPGDDGAGGAPPRRAGSGVRCLTTRSAPSRTSPSATT